MMFLTFHGRERFHHQQPASSEPGHQGAHAGGEQHGGAPHESPAVVTVPLIALAIPSVLIGALTVAAVLFGDYFGTSIFVRPANNVIASAAQEFHGAVSYALHGFVAPPFWLAAAGALCAWVFFLWRPQLADRAAVRLRWLYTLLVNKYYFDWFNEKVIAALTREIGVGLWKGGDQGLIDGVLVDGTAEGVTWFGALLRRVQSGYLYSYAFWMVIGLAVLLGWFLTRMQH